MDVEYSFKEPVMKNLIKAAICATLLAAASAVPAFANEVGFTRLTVDDPMGGQMLVSLWYPTQESASKVKLGPYKFDAARDAVPLQGPHGLVMMSHGTEGSDLGHRNVALALARAGIVVAAPLHPRNNFKDNSGVGRKIVMEGRPKQVSAVIDALKMHPIWGAVIDPDRVGAFGFSLGGYTVLALLGAAPDMQRAVDHCTTDTPDPFCDFVEGEVAALRQLVKQEYDGPLTDLHDPRICTASIADPVAVLFPDAALNGIEAENLQIWRPEDQNVLLADAHVNRLITQLNQRTGIPQVTARMVEGAQHYSFLAPFPWRLKWVLPSALTRDAKGFDRSDFQESFARETTDFMLKSFEACRSRE
jgi:predicted dienelactone hydrolase